MSKKPPSYTLHRSTGQARVRIDGRDHYLGRYGSAESHAAYERILAEWRLRQTAATQGPTPAEQAMPSTARTVGEVLSLFYSHVERRLAAAEPAHRYRETRNYWHSFRPVDVMFGALPVDQFGPRALRAVRQRMVQGWQDEARGRDYEPLCRSEANRRVVRVRQAFRWAVGEELIAGEVLHRLEAVAALKPGEDGAREKPPIRAVPEAVVEATLPYLGEVVAAMVRLQLLTGMRPGEVCRLTPGQVLRGEQLEVDGLSLPLAGLWAYVPQRHKTAHRGHKRVVWIGPQAQELLAPYLDRGPDAACFSPREAVEKWRVMLRKRRQTPVQPSQYTRAAAWPKKRPGTAYCPDSYRQAVDRACRAAKAPHWHPHQLRHTAATVLTRLHGWDVARILLGHRSLDATRIYAEDNLSAARDAAKKTG